MNQLKLKVYNLREIECNDSIRKDSTQETSSSPSLLEESSNRQIYRRDSFQVDTSGDENWECGDEVKAPDADDEIPPCDVNEFESGSDDSWELYKEALPNVDDGQDLNGEDDSMAIYQAAALAISDGSLS